jgi:hypothetical protein
MIQLVIVIITIALTAALALASINYLPWWHKSAGDAEQVVRSSLVQLEQAYDATVRAANGTAPAVTGDADGGLMAQFGAVLKFQPAAPAGFTWTYGQHANDGTRYAGLNYFCLRPVVQAADQGAGEGVYKGLQRARSIYSPDQVVISAACDATADSGLPTAYPTPVYVTMFVRYTSGVTL